MTDLANIDGRLVPREQAFISAFDRGFLYGDSVYETIRTYGGRPFLIRRHLTRLAASAERLQLRLVQPLEEIERRVRLSVEAAGNPESLVRVILSRGAAAIGLDPSLAKQPTLVMLITAFQPLPEQVYENGAKVQLVSIVRNPIRALDPRIKTSNQLNNILAYMEAKSAGCTEAFMLNAAGELAEGTTSNIFVIHQRRLVTPPLDAGILEGITRDLVLELADSEGFETREQTLVPEDLFGADECFLTATTKEILPVVRVSGRIIGSGRPGPVTRELLQTYRTKVQALLATE